MDSTTSTHPSKTSPMMMQWHTCKKMAEDAVLLFRMGDFYEAFYDDATLLARELELTLTKRQGIPMSGVPVHTYDNYVDRLVSKGYRVAVAEQIGDPKKSKGLVKREVVRVVTPGTLVNSQLLSDKSNNYFAGIAQVGKIFGVAFLDLTTSEFRVIEFDNLADLYSECYRFHPAEYLVSDSFKDKHAAMFEDLKLNYKFLVSSQEDWHFDHRLCVDFLVEHFQVHSLEGFGLGAMTAGINAAGALLQHLQDHLCLSIDHIGHPQPYTTSLFMALDQNTQRNLELTASQKDGGRQHTLLEMIDHSVTPMGARLVTRWLKQPLLDAGEIQARHNAVSMLIDAPEKLSELRESLERVRDLERLMMKISSGYASPRDVLALCESLEPLPEIKTLLENFNEGLLAHEGEQIKALPELVELLRNALSETPPLRVSDGNIFRDGYHQELDELRSLSRDGKTWMANYQNRIREETGIKKLKIGFNRMFGYYLEVSKGQTAHVPESFNRRQTLVNAERYTTLELKEYESKVLTAQERSTALETELYQQLREKVATYSSAILTIAKSLATVDVLQGLADVARQNRYQRPVVDQSDVIHIEGGRHPVIEGAHLGEAFIPNDTLLDGDSQRLHIITGPNMAGKSTYIRQVALIVIMAQMGSFVPADSAHIGIVDKVFTRIGASDDLSRGQSTFMVEMTETANILNNCSDRSLVILDEIGRGTSTYDGISIASAVAEYLLETRGHRAKTLFATHYGELTDLEGRIPGAVNYNVAVKEHADKIIFLRKIVQGGTDKSYGIHVGGLAGLPREVLRRAQDILKHLEDNAVQHNPFHRKKVAKSSKSRGKNPKAEVQYLLFSPESAPTPTETSVNPTDEEVLHELRTLDINHLSPVEALTTLAKLSQRLHDDTIEV